MTNRAEKPTDAGVNRTGIAASPIDGHRLVEAAEATIPGMTNGTTFESARMELARGAGPVGTLPPPLSLKGVFKTIVEAAKGHEPTVFLDKLGERLAFERTGVRLYDALLAKHEAADRHVDAPRRELERIRDDEHRHFWLVREAIEDLGCDPTAITPCADVISVAGAGWIQVLSDSRTTFTQCLDVILIAELADTDGWMLLTGLAEGLGLDELASRFRIANLQEEEHVARVREWIARAVYDQAGVEPAPPPGAEPARL